MDVYFLNSLDPGTALGRSVVILLLIVFTKTHNPVHPSIYLDPSIPIGIGILYHFDIQIVLAISTQFFLHRYVRFLKKRYTETPVHPVHPDTSLGPGTPMGTS